jgi:hypothetical protein
MSLLTDGLLRWRLAGNRRPDNSPHSKRDYADVSRASGHVEGRTFSPIARILTNECPRWPIDRTAASGEYLLQARPRLPWCTNATSGREHTTVRDVVYEFDASGPERGRLGPRAQGNDYTRTWPNDPWLVVFPSTGAARPASRNMRMPQVRRLQIAVNVK